MGDRMYGLLEYIDKDMDLCVDEAGPMIFASSAEKLAIVFEKITCLQPDGVKRRAAAKQCLVQAAYGCTFDRMRWLVETLPMDPKDVHNVLTSGACGEGNPGRGRAIRRLLERLGRVCLTTSDFIFYRPFMLSILAAHMEKAKRIDWPPRKPRSIRSRRIASPSLSLCWRQTKAGTLLWLAASSNT
ncbi:Aste57867_3804 [Aphanomyces stellatus]|uniref:Aste57867_3804 protein n=1 Tax=Aphanomyces stellatus TaxID=120398 RepID=A0A485KET9_9STRA|nr:hypothetical protein As57867_003793 [Aphanomyces stellatus]VFT80953.1 Aste57867_3804 [Aphanomyces stellatus]